MRSRVHFWTAGSTGHARLPRWEAVLVGRRAWQGAAALLIVACGVAGGGGVTTSSPGSPGEQGDIRIPGCGHPGRRDA